MHLSSCSFRLHKLFLRTSLLYMAPPALCDLIVLWRLPLVMGLSLETLQLLDTLQEEAR